MVSFSMKRKPGSDFCYSKKNIGDQSGGKKCTTYVQISESGKDR
jgi:hypothetical protein